METVIAGNISDTNSVTPPLRNTHCFICGKPFNTERFGKLYCSAKCKQFGYNHKERLNPPKQLHVEIFLFFRHEMKNMSNHTRHLSV